MIYLDASALITLIAGRQYAAELRQFLAGKPGMPMGTFTIGFVETVRTSIGSAITRRRCGDLMQNFTEILVTDEVRDQAALLPAGVRTLEAVTSPARR